MAILIPSPVIGVLQGSVGNLVFVPTKEEKVHVRRRPVRVAAFTTGELKGQAFLTTGNAYVTRIRQGAAVSAVYQNAARISGRRACDLTRADFLNPPVIKDVDLSGYTGKAQRLLTAAPSVW